MGKLFDELHFDYVVDQFEEIEKWQKVHSDNKLYIWGSGSVANGVINALKKRGIKVDGCFVNITDYNLDSRIAAQNIPIIMLDDLLSKNVDFSVIMGHSHYELKDLLAEYRQIKKIWCLNNIVREDIVISKTFVKENAEFFEKTYVKLGDELSRKNMVAYLNAIVTQDENWIDSFFNYSTTYFDNDIISFTDNEVYFDLGTWNGESVKNFIKSCKNFKQILAVEVQPLMCKKLSEEWRYDKRITVCNIGISDHEGKDYFRFDDQSTCIVNEAGILVPVTTVDSLCSIVPNVTTIKICIGNTILPIINGAETTIHTCLPKLIIAAGIDFRALIDYIPRIEAIAGENRYNYYLRFMSAMTESLVLYAIPRGI